MMKKMIIIICCMILMTACGHEHEYTSEITKEATCTEPGVLTYTCVKGDDSYTEEIEAAHPIEVGLCNKCGEFVTHKCVGMITDCLDEAITYVRAGQSEGLKAGDYYTNYKNAAEYFDEAWWNFKKAKDLCDAYPYFSRLGSKIQKIMDALPVKIDGDDYDSLIAFTQKVIESSEACEAIGDELMKISEDMSND